MATAYEDPNALTAAVTETPAPVAAPTSTPSAGIPSAEKSLTNMLSSDSSYLQQARQQGTQAAADRGLMNTSLAGQASEGAAIQAAAPIAAQDAAAEQAERQLGLSTSANLQGQYTQGVQQIMDNAAISINEIETSQNIPTAEKDAMIANTIARRDADMKFMTEFYNAMPVYQPNWTTLPSLAPVPGIA